MNERAKIVDFYLQKIAGKDFDISQVRKDLERNNIDENEIKVIVRLVDNELQSRLLTKTHNNRANDLVYVGAVITLVGVAITLGTYTGLIDMGNSFLIVYGPFLGGLSILSVGLTRRKKS